MQLIKIPTGFLFVDEYSRGKLETLSIADYGKAVNVKADFLGLTNEINGVPNAVCMPLSEKWVITLSTQYGCSQQCRFCDVPKIPMRGNATFDDLYRQFKNAINVFGGNQTYTERLNLHFARMGEPIYNKAVFEFAEWLYANKLQLKRDCGLSVETLHPVLTTCLPSGFKFLEERIMDWCRIKNEVYNGQAGFQFSINSTNEEQRTHMFNGGSISLEEFAKIADKMPEPISRKYCLNFAYATDYEIDGARLAELFDPSKFMCKITPIHNNEACRANGIETIGGYETYLPYKKPEESLKAAGFDVLVFVPSMDEEDGLVTCGNLVLSGSQVKNETEKHKISGLDIPVVNSVF